MPGLDKSQNQVNTSRSTARIILGQVLRHTAFDRLAGCHEEVKITLTAGWALTYVASLEW